MKQSMRPKVRPLHRESIRHTTAGVIAGVVALVLLGWLTSAGSDQRVVSMTGITVVFGVYGPTYLLLTSQVFRGVRGPALRNRLKRSDQRHTLLNLLFLGGPRSWAMLIAVIGVVSVLLLATGDTRHNAGLVAACVLCVVGTWVLLVAVFSVEYMRTWANDGGLEFPGDRNVGFPDFLYLSVQLSTTFSSSDVQLLDTRTRHLATVHSLIAFAYSSVIIAVFASLLISNAG